MRKIRNAGARRPIYSGLRGSIARAFDSTVGLVAPGVAHEMRKSRMRSAALLAFEAAEITRLAPRKSTHSGDSSILPNLQNLRNVCRDLVRNDAHAGRAVQILEELVVGEGIRPRSGATAKATGATEAEVADWNARVDEVWNDWADDEELCDATQRSTFYDLQALALRARVTDGEFLVHFAMRDGSLALELIDVDRLCSPGDRDAEKVRGGVEIDEFGAPVAFYILPHHPSDQVFGASWTVNPRRVAKKSGELAVMLHGFTPQIGANRGVPRLVPGADYLRHLHHYLSSELIAARAASNYAVFIKRSITADDPELTPVQGATAVNGLEHHETIEPGTNLYLNEGEEPVPFSPNRPGAQFDPFVVRMLRAIASASGLAYEQVCLDFGRMNLSSARAMLREVHRGTDLERRRFVRQFCAPARRNLILHKIATGELVAPTRFLERARAWLACSWVAPAYGMVDPLSDIEASRKACDANLSTPFAEAQRWGGDFETILRERARALVMARELEVENGLEPGSLTKESPERIESSSTAKQEAAPSAARNGDPEEDATRQPSPPEADDVPDDDVEEPEPKDA